MEQKAWERLFFETQSKLRPFSPELVQHCSNTELCTNCHLRCGCPMRIMFYMDPVRFEIIVQTAELQANKDLNQPLSAIEKSISSQLCYEATQHLRKKRDTELRSYYWYSFT